MLITIDASALIVASTCELPIVTALVSPSTLNNSSVAAQALLPPACFTIKKSAAESLLPLESRLIYIAP